MLRWWEFEQERIRGQRIIFNAATVRDRKPVRRPLDLALLFEMEIVRLKIAYEFQIVSFQYCNSPPLPHNKAAGS